MKHFKFTIRVKVAQKLVPQVYVDWYSGQTEAEARELCLEDMHRYGIKPESATITVEEVEVLP